MRRLAKIMTAAAAMLLLTGAIAACTIEDAEVVDPTRPFANAYAAVTEAKEIAQEITVVKGKLVEYEREKTYVKGDTEYTVTETERTLNKTASESEEPYTETVKPETTVTKAETFISGMTLHAAYFEEGAEIRADELKANVKAESIDSLFHLSEGHAELSDVTIALKISEGKLTSFETTFLSGAYSVTITIAFTY